MRRFIISSVVSATFVIVGTMGSSPTYANPASTWVLNLNVVNASSASSGCTIPHNCDLTTTADRAVLFSSFTTLQTQSGGRVEQEPPGFMGTPAAGFTEIAVQSDGALTFMTMNGHGLTCAPGCDNLATSTPNPTDHFVVYKITDTGTHNIGDTLVATASQDSVHLDSRTIVVVGPPASVGGIAEQPDVTVLPAGQQRLASGSRHAVYILAFAAAFTPAAVGTAVRRKRRRA